MPQGIANAAVDGVNSGNPVWLVLLGGAIVFFIGDRILHWLIKFRARNSKPEVAQDPQTVKLLYRIANTMDKIEERTADHDEATARALAKLSEAQSDLILRTASNAGHLATIESQVLALLNKAAT